MVGVLEVNGGLKRQVHSKIQWWAKSQWWARSQWWAKTPGTFKNSMVGVFTLLNGGLEVNGGLKRQVQ